MIAVIGVIWLFVFGPLYAYRVYVRPISPTWLSVMLGTGGTLVGITAINAGAFGVETGLWASAVAWGGFIATGIPMILGQVRKGEENIREAQARAHQTGRLAGTNDETEAASTFN